MGFFDALLSGAVEDGGANRVSVERAVVSGRLTALERFMGDCERTVLRVCLTGDVGREETYCFLGDGGAWADSLVGDAGRDIGLNFCGDWSRDYLLAKLAC